MAYYAEGNMLRIKQILRVLKKCGVISVELLALGVLAKILPGTHEIGVAIIHIAIWPFVMNLGFAVFDTSMHASEV